MEVINERRVSQIPSLRSRVLRNSAILVSGVAEMEGETRSLGHEEMMESALKRKPDMVPGEERLEERTKKQQKGDAEGDEMIDASSDGKKGGGDQNGNADKGKGKGKGKGKAVLSAADKGKGKMVAEEVGFEEEHGNSEVDRDGDGDKMYLSYYPLEKLNPDNILPYSARRLCTIPAKNYIVEDDDDYDDEDDEDALDDVEEKFIDEYDYYDYDDDEEEEEEEGEEEEEEEEV